MENYFSFAKETARELDRAVKHCAMGRVWDVEEEKKRCDDCGKVMPKDDMFPVKYENGMTDWFCEYCWEEHPMKEEQERQQSEDDSADGQYKGGWA